MFDALLISKPSLNNKGSNKFMKNVGCIKKKDNVQNCSNLFIKFHCVILHPIVPYLSDLYND